MACIRLTTGELVFKREPPMTMEEAEASVRERNRRAEKMGIKARYTATDD